MYKHTQVRRQTTNTFTLSTINQYNQAGLKKIHIQAFHANVYCYSIEVIFDLLYVPIMYAYCWYEMSTSCDFYFY